MDKEEKLIREYFKFDDINQTETISVLPLTLIDMLLEYKHKIKKLHTYRVQKLEEIIKRFMQATEIAKMQNGDWFKEVYNDAGALNLHNVMKLVCENCHKKTASRYDRITGLYLCKDCYSKQTVL